MPKQRVRLLAALATALMIIGGAGVAAPAQAAPAQAGPAQAARSYDARAHDSVAAPGAVLLAAKRPTKVTVPSNYVYDPKLGALHDYCTHAPDEFPAPFAPNADFRGPCARHDLCYAGTTSPKTCDKRLRRNLFRNCEHYYGKYHPLRAACKAAALTYWAAVVAT